MSEIAGFPAAPRRPARAAAASRAPGVVPVLALAFPAALAAAAATLIAGGGIAGALAAYVFGGAATLVAGAVVIAAPWRRLARPARRWASRLAAGVAGPAQFIGR